MRIAILVRSSIFAALVFPGNALAQKIESIIDIYGDVHGNYLMNPKSVAIDASGNVYVAGTSTDNVFKVQEIGLATEILDQTAGGVGAELLHPRSITVDRLGNLYVAGLHSDNVFQVSPDGEVTLILDERGDGKGNILDAPVSIAVDEDLNVYVAALISDNVFKVSTNRDVTQILDAEGNGAGNRLDWANAVDVDALGNVYVAGYNSGNVFKVQADGDISTIIDTSGDGLGNTLEHANDVAVDDRGIVYVTAGSMGDAFISEPRRERNVFRIDRDGKIDQIFDHSQLEDGVDIKDPTGVAVDTNGAVYVAGSQSHNIFKIEPDGELTELANVEGSGGDHYLYRPRSIAVDHRGVVITASFGSRSDVFRIVPEGVEVQPLLDTGEAAFYSHGVLSVPAIKVGNEFYSLEIRFVRNFVFSYWELVSYKKVDPPNTETYAELRGDTVFIPKMLYSAQYYSVELKTTATEPSVRFSVKEVAPIESPQ